MVLVPVFGSSEEVFHYLTATGHRALDMNRSLSTLFYSSSAKHEITVEMLIDFLTTWYLLG